MNKFLVLVFLIFLMGCDLGTTSNSTIDTTATTTEEEFKPTFLGMRNGTDENFVASVSHIWSSPNIELSSKPILSLLEENTEEEFIDGIRIVAKNEEVVILFDIQQPVDESYIKSDFAVQLYSNYNFTTGDLMPDGSYDYEWFSRDYQGFGALYMLKTDTPNLDSLVIKIPIKGDYSELQEIGVEKINYDGENGVEINYSEEAISNLKFGIAKKTGDNYISSFLNQSIFNRESNILSLYLGDLYVIGTEFFAVYENTLYTITIEGEVLLLNNDLLSNSYLVERSATVSSCYLDIDLTDYKEYTVSAFDLSFTYVYLVINEESYSSTFIVTIDAEMAE